MRSFATSTRRARSGAPPGAPYVINTADGRTAYVGTDSKEGLVNPLRFRNRAVVVTGGASGIGENAVREFVWEGANVALLDTDAARGRSLAKELNSADADAGAGNRSVPRYRLFVTPLRSALLICCAVDLVVIGV